MRILPLVHPGITEGEWREMLADRVRRWYGVPTCSEPGCDDPSMPDGNYCALCYVGLVPRRARLFRPPPPVPE